MKAGAVKLLRFFGLTILVTGGKTNMCSDKKIKETESEEISGGKIDPLNPNFVYCPKCQTSILKTHTVRSEPAGNGQPAVCIYICPNCKTQFGRPFGPQFPGTRINN